MVHQSKRMQTRLPYCETTLLQLTAASDDNNNAGGSKMVLTIIRTPVSSPL